MKKGSQRRARTSARPPRRPNRNDVRAEYEKRLAAHPDARLYVLRLYVTGSTPRSSAAVATIRSICDQYLSGNYDLEVVDIYQQPAAAVGAQIVAAPTLIKYRPAPLRRMVGTLADRERVLAGLGLPPGAGRSAAGGPSPGPEGAG